MSIILGPNRYGKAETRLVRVVRDGGVHHIKDVNVGSSLSGDMEAVHLTGSNASVLPTDTQKNTAYAFARKHGIDQIEDFALLLARHYVGSQPAIHHARVEIEEYSWSRIPVSGDRGESGKQHSFVRDGAEVRTCVVHHDRDGRTTVVSGLTDLVVLNSTGSEFHGYIVDEYTTLQPTTDRILATAVSAQWRHTGDDSDFGPSYREVRTCLLEAFAETHSLSLQQTLYEMGKRVLNTRDEVCEIRFAMPNKHHFLVDLSPFGLDNDNEVFHAADRPYGLIEGTVLRADAPDAGFAWE
ncbi:urate oxidase [Nonomuraea sp. NN258]|uniref:factor-independent urate hydroxylase n=1 Tax=Nonomuraea antri TaxID=2730852 RepID=UPI00156975DD|nr:urate oxidase [Nonomuraea antri]NRQ35867.1 urate oxidase [Nonomuraea antri]